jgi:hypothetical protein
MPSPLPKPERSHHHQNKIENELSEVKNMTTLIRKNINGTHDQMIFLTKDNLVQNLSETKVGGFAQNIAKFDQLRHELLHPYIWKLCTQLFSQEVLVLDARVESILGGIQYCLDPNRYLKNPENLPVFNNKKNECINMFNRYASFLIAMSMVRNYQEEFSNITAKINRDIDRFEEIESGDVSFFYYFKNLEISKDKIVEDIQIFIDDCKKGVNFVSGKYCTEQYFYLPQIMKEFVFSEEITFENQIHVLSELQPDDIFLILEDLSISKKLVYLFEKYKNNSDEIDTSQLYSTNFFDLFK